MNQLQREIAHLSRQNSSLLSYKKPKFQVLSFFVHYELIL